MRLLIADANVATLVPRLAQARLQRSACATRNCEVQSH